MSDNYVENNEKTWDAIAKSFDVTRRKPWKQCIDFIDTLSIGDTAADICCGNGRHLIPLTGHCKNAIGVDISGELLHIVHRKLKEEKIQNAGLIHSDVTNIPLKNESMDAVLFIASLHNIKGRRKRVQSLMEIKRVLKSNGRALISVWSRWQDKYRKRFLKKWFVQVGQTEFGDINIYWRQHGLDIPRFYHLYGKRELLLDLRKAGLETLEIQEVKLHSKKHPDNYFALVK